MRIPDGMGWDGMRRDQVPSPRNPAIPKSQRCRLGSLNLRALLLCFEASQRASSESDSRLCPLPTFHVARMRQLLGARSLWPAEGALVAASSCGPDGGRRRYACRSREQTTAALLLRARGSALPVADAFSLMRDAGNGQSGAPQSKAAAPLRGNRQWCLPQSQITGLGPTGGPRTVPPGMGAGSPVTAALTGAAAAAAERSTL